MKLRSLTPEILVPRLGEYLVQKKHLTALDLNRALAFQQDKTSAGQPCLLGQALIELGLVDRATLDQAITEQILQLRTALEEANRSLEQRVAARTAELQEALRKLSELSQLKANFIANISHELRTPLTHIKGYLELLVNESLGTLTDEQRNALNVSLRATARLERLIENLLLFSLASRGEMTLRLASVDIQQVAKAMAGFSQPAADDRGVALVTNIPADIPRVQADEKMISWVILHLLENAIKFSSPGGQVMLSVQHVRDTLVEVSVSDTGIGIPAKRLQEIFEPFHQLDGSPARRYGGAGLGLTLVRDILDAHGSVIDVKSEEGKGSVFKFTLLAVALPP